MMIDKVATILISAILIIAFLINVKAIITKFDAINCLKPLIIKTKQ